VEIRLTQKHIVAINFLLIGLATYFAAKCVTEIIAMRVEPTPLSSKASKTMMQPDMRPRDRTGYETIVERDIFNLVPIQKAAQVPVVEDLRVKLDGIATSTSGKPYAVIEDPGGAQSVYGLGDDVPNAGKLVEIRKDRVIIDRGGGSRVALELPKDELASVGSAPVSMAPMGVRIPAGRAPVNDSMMGQDVIRMGPTHFAVSRSALDKDLANPGELFTQMRAVPNMQNGKSNGFALSEIQQGSLFDKIGLQNGDVVSAVGGEAISDPTRAIEMLKGLRDQRNVSIQIIRHGRPLTITYDME